MNTKRWMITIGIFSILAISGILIGFKNMINPHNTGKVYSQPILLENNEEMVNFFADTDKTGENLETAYIIENLYFYSTDNTDYMNASGEFISLDCGILLKTTTLHIIIRNCTFEDFNTGILTYSARNVIIENCTFLNCVNAIFLTHSDSIKVDSNVFKSSFFDGVRLKNTTSSTIESNRFSECHCSLELSSSKYNSIFDNNITNKPINSYNRIFQGLSLYNSSDNMIFNNSFTFASFQSYNSDLYQFNSTNYYNQMPVRVFESLHNFTFNNQPIGYWIFSNCSNITLKQLSSLSSSGYLEFYDCTDFLFYNCTFGSDVSHFTNSEVITLRSCSRFTISQSIFLTSDGAIWLNQSNETIIEQSLFECNDVSIAMTDGLNLSIFNNWFIDCRRAIFESGISNLRFNNNSLQDSRFYISSINEEWDFSHNTFNSLNISIYYNTNGLNLTQAIEEDEAGYIYIFNCGHFSLDAKNQLDLAVLDIYNSFDFQIGNFGSNAKINSIIIADSSDFIVKNIIFHNNLSNGLLLEENTLFSISNVTVEKILGPGMRILASTFFRVSDIQANQNLNGIFILHSESFSLINLNANNNEENGLYILDSEDFSIHSSSFMNNRENGILLVHASDSWIVENQFRNNSFSGIYALLCYDILVSNNNFTATSLDSYGIYNLVTLFHNELYNNFQGYFKAETLSIIKNLTLSTQYYSLVYRIEISDTSHQKWTSIELVGNYVRISCDESISYSYIEENNLIINIEEE